MRKLIMLALAVSVGTPAIAQVYVGPYVKRDGTVVQGHYRSEPNQTATDNWSSRPNVNPYTGQEGTRDPYAQPRREAPYNPYASSSRASSYPNR